MVYQITQFVLIIQPYKLYSQQAHRGLGFQICGSVNHVTAMYDQGKRSKITRLRNTSAARML